MKAFKDLCSVAALIPGKNIDTDQIIPARFLKLARGDGLDKAFFHDFRFDKNGNEIEDFILNQQGYRQSEILVVDENFGCGSSREAAVYSLVEFGVKVIIAPSLGDIFHNNCLKNGVLPIVLDPLGYAQVLEFLKSSELTKLCISLEENSICSADLSKKVSFEIEGFWRECLLKGIDDLTLTLSKMNEVLDFEKQYHQTYPWQRIASK